VSENERGSRRKGGALVGVRRRRRGSGTEGERKCGWRQLSEWQRAKDRMGGMPAREESILRGGKGREAIRGKGKGGRGEERREGRKRKERREKREERRENREKRTERRERREQNRTERRE
jgi:hypothetical protein